MFIDVWPSVSNSCTGTRACVLMVADGVEAVFPPETRVPVGADETRQHLQLRLVWLVRETLDLLPVQPGIQHRRGGPHSARERLAPERRAHQPEKRLRIVAFLQPEILDLAILRQEPRPGLRF